MPDDVRVGAMSAPMTEATRYVARYLTSREESWAYPAYDGYPGGPTDLITEQDLFAPTLLNAGIDLSAYYAFLDRLDEINSRLADLPADVPLAQADDTQIVAVAHVIGVLNGGGIPGIQLTKFSKVLHRKRPAIVPLYDAHIRACYQDGPDAPVPVVTGRRSWEEFACLWLAAVRCDLRTQEGSWDELTALTPDGGPAITPLRALDIVGWGLGQPGLANWARYSSAGGAN